MVYYFDRGDDGVVVGGRTRGGSCRGGEGSNGEVRRRKSDGDECEKMKSTVGSWFQRLASGPSPRGRGH